MPRLRNTDLTSCERHSCLSAGLIAAHPFEKGVPCSGVKITDPAPGTSIRLSVLLVQVPGPRDQKLDQRCIHLPGHYHQVAVCFVLCTFQVSCVLLCSAAVD